MSETVAIFLDLFVLVGLLATYKLIRINHRRICKLEDRKDD